MNASKNVRALLNRFSRNLATIKSAIGIENSTNNFSLNSLMETQIMNVYNLTTGLNFINANLLEKNYPAIDGIDIENKMMVQVTSTFSYEKIETTIKKIIERNLHEKYDHLILIFLCDKKKVSNAFKTKIEKLLEGKFKFDLDSDVIDFDDIFRLHQYSQDIEKLLRVVTLLDEFLDFVPEYSLSGYDALCVCFHEEEIENVFKLVDGIIKKGINVYLSSKKLVEKFNIERHPLKDFIILVHPSMPLENISYCITVLSKSFINQLVSNQQSSNFLYEHIIKNEIKTEFVSFDNHLKDYKMVRDKIKSYRSMQNLEKTLEEILEDRINSSAYGNIKIEEIKQELINMNNNFNAKVLGEDVDFSLLNFKIIDQDDLELNYLVLSKEFTLTKIEEFISKYRLKTLKNINILVVKNYAHITRRRLENIKMAFNNQRCYYVDEHLFDKRYKSLQQNSILNTAEFVSPVVRHNEELLRINDIIHWIFNNSNSSIAIINGAGGIGKTTVCQKINDIIIENNDRIIVIFISSEKYIEVFGRNATNGDTEYDIYNIFNSCHPHASIIDKNSFYLNYSLGNIVIIFDGIDEIISTIHSFDLFKFLGKLENLQTGLGKGKILINCRDTYINDVKEFYSKKNEQKIQIYDLLGFSEDLARKFFQKHFDQEELVKSSIKLVKDFFDQETGTIYKYPPFILEIVIQIVTPDFVIEEIDSEFSSKILQFNDPNDVVIYRICNREFIKKDKHGFQLDIDQQVRFLCELAIEEKGQIFKKEFSRVLEQVGVNDRVGEFARGLIDHPLLMSFNNRYIFRFDFFNTYFKSVSIFNMLSTNIPIHFTENLINIIAFDCNFNSLISKSIILKARNCKIPFSKCLENSKTVIQSILKFESENKNLLNVLKKAISNILTMVLASRHLNYSNEYIINYIFGNKNHEIRNFYFIDVPQFANIEFNFGGFYFSESEIKNYGSFFECKFDDNTYFDNTCNISSVYNPKINWKNVTVDLKYFDKGIQGDNSIVRIMRVKNNGDTHFKRLIREYLLFFYISNELRIELPEKFIIIEDAHVKVSLLTRILESNDIINKVENGIIYLNEKLKFKVIKFLTQGLPFSQLNRGLVELKKIVERGNVD